MAWTTPKTWSTGEVVGATDMNTYIRDNQLALLNPQSDIWTGNLTDNPGSTSWVDVDSTNLSLDITPVGDTVLIGYVGFLTAATNFGAIHVDVDQVGTGRVSGTGAGLVTGSDNYDNVSFVCRVTGLTPGQSYTFRLQFKEQASNGEELNSRQFWVVEVS